MRTTVTQIGNSIGLIIPKEIAHKMKIKKGDSVFLTETQVGCAFSRYDKEVERQIEAARQGMKDYRNTLRKLAE